MRNVDSPIWVILKRSMDELDFGDASLSDGLWFAGGSFDEDVHLLTNIKWRFIRTL